MPRDVVTLFAQDEGKKLIARHCRNIRLPVADLRDLVETVVEMNVTELPCKLLNEIGGFKMVEVHLPIAGDQWDSL